MPWDVELNIRLAFMALANFLALTVSKAAGEPRTNLAGNLLLLVDWEVDKRIVLGADQWNGIAVLLKPRPWRYHSLMLFSVLLRVRSNMKRMATASLQTSGSMLTNSRCPPRSQIEKVISVFRMEMVFSMKLTPATSV